MRRLSISTLLAMLLLTLSLTAIAEHPAEGYVGTVIETMDSGTYTYVLVDTGSEQVWAAAPQFKVAVGDEVVVPTQMPMPDFKSKTMDRTFELLFFASNIPNVNEVSAEEKKPHSHDGMPIPGMSKKEGPKEPAVGDIKPAGQTIGELYTKRDEFAGKDILVRGQVVKALEGIMGTNWLHVRDGSGEPGSNDLTITTSAVFKKGDVVLVSGKLTLNRDFGMGYFYELIVEGATVTIE
jgi:hypothetical protein